MIAWTQPATWCSVTLDILLIVPLPRRRLAPFQRQIAPTFRRLRQRRGQHHPRNPANIPLSSRLPCRRRLLLLLLLCRLRIQFRSSSRIRIFLPTSCQPFILPPRLVFLRICNSPPASHPSRVASNTMQTLTTAVKTLLLLREASILLDTAHFFFSLGKGSEGDRWCQLVEHPSFRLTSRCAQLLPDVHRTSKGGRCTV
jgi:hypothetical protein